MTQLEELIAELHNLERELTRFETRYGLLSETFYAWYQSGQEPEDTGWVQDLALWAGTYQLKLRRQEKYRRLIAEALARHNVPTLMRESLLVGSAACSSPPSTSTKHSSMVCEIFFLPSALRPCALFARGQLRDGWLE